MGFAAARRIDGGACERLLGNGARRLQVAEHEAKRKRRPQPSNRHLSAPVGCRQQEHAIEVLLHFNRRVAAAGIQRDRQAGAQRELLLVAIPSRRQSVDDRQGVRQAAHRLLRGRQAGGDGGRTFEERHGTRRLSAAIEMSGNRRAHVIQAVGKEQLHPLRDAPMDETPARGSDSAVGDLADAVVAEVPPLLRLNADDVTPPELVERTDERVFFEVACLGENIEPEIPAHRCRDLGGCPGVLGEQPQSSGHNGLHLWRRRVDGGTRLLRQLHASALDNEQRMAFGLAERAGQRRLVQGMLGHLAGQLRRGGPVEGTEGDRHQPIVAIELTEQPSQRRIILLLLRAHGADNQASRRRTSTRTK